MADVVGICNSALLKIGEPQIVSLSDGSKAASDCAEQYPKLRDQELRTHLWNFAKRRAKLPRLTAAPAFGFAHQYQLPADWLRIITVHNNEAGLGGVRYSLEGRRILSDAEALYLVYVGTVEDPNEMAADFREVLALLLAADLAVSIASSNALRESMLALYRRRTLQARGSDAIEDWPQPLPESSWVTARNRGHSDGRGCR